MHYRNLILRISRTGDGYRARVIDSPAGANQAHDFAAPDLPSPPHQTAEDEQPRRDVRRSGGQAHLPLRRAGQALFETVFAGDVRNAYRVSIGLTRNAGDGLRLQLQLSEVPETVEWPWEALFDPENGQFVSVWGTSMIRTLDMAAAPPPAAMVPPLRVLVVAANPTGQLKLNVDQEWNLIESALQTKSRQGQVRLERLEHATVPRLLECLESQPRHIVHFMGHGEFDPQTGDGHLVLEDDKGRAQELSTERLGAILSSQTQLRLLFLNACDGARHSPVDPFTGVAQSLLRQGVPAVVAMSSAIRDDLASQFSASFYRSLAEKPSIETAVAKARQQLFSRIDHDAWATPVFFAQRTDHLDLSSAFPRSKKPWYWTGVTAGLVLAAAFSPYWWPASTSGPPVPNHLEIKPEEGPVGPYPRKAALCPAPEELEIEFRYLPAGTLRFGPGDGKPVRIDRPFCLAIHETTQAQWQAVMAEGAENPSAYQSPDKPIHRVTELEIYRFLRRLNLLVDGNPFRLPTELEWEYAARQGDTFDLALETDEWIEAHANCRSTSGADGYDGVAPVGKFKPDAWGFYDLRGNVWEWALEDLDSTIGAEDLIARGGSFESKPENCRATTNKRRNSMRRTQEIGFRLARDPIEPTDD